MKTVGSLNEVAMELLKAVECDRVTCEDVVLVESGPYYAQMLFNYGVILGEVVSNTYLTGSKRLTALQVNHLLDLGWSAPNTPCQSSCERPHPNFHRTWPDGVPSERIVRDLLASMISVCIRFEGEPLTFIREPRHGHPSTGLPCNH